MPLAPDPDGRFCLVCGRVLEQMLDPDGRLLPRYRHARVDEPTDHLPVAARPSDAPGQVLYRCDFCLAEPITHTLVVDHDIERPALNLAWDAEWAMCPICTQYVLADQWLELRRHAFASFESRHGAVSDRVKMELRTVYAEIRRSLVMIYAEAAP